MTTSNAVSLLPIMGYIVGVVLVAYMTIRAYTYVMQRRNQSVALPRPVYEAASKKSPFSFSRTNRREWYMSRLSFPWKRSPTDSSPKYKAVASAKDLSVELLPTTGLPPPPTSIPTPPLVSPDTSASSRFSVSVPSSPKRQPRPFWQQTPSSPPSLKGYRNVQHPTFPRPPSPHALLATTPPQRHTRSRSLGGVPVRRLSGGQSGLRNKVDVELQDFVPGHARGSSEEHLLIDLSYSSDDQAAEPRNYPTGISPAASDIGVLPSSVDSKGVEPRPMELVDIGDDLNVGSTEQDSAAWMWYNFNAPSTIRAYDAEILAPRPQAVPFSGERKLASPLPFPKTEKLVDIPSNEVAYLGLHSLDSSATLVEVESDVLGQSPPIKASVDIRTSQSVNTDPFSDVFAVDYIPYEPQVRIEPHDNNDDQVQDDQSTPFSHDIHVETSVDVELVFVENPLVKEDSNSWVSVGASLSSTSISPIPSPVDFLSPTVAAGSSPLEKTADWRWVEVDDAWGDHVSVQDETLTPAYDGDSHLKDQQRESGFMESSPGGCLMATVLDGDEVPHLSLDDSPPTEELQPSRVVGGQFDDEGEEDATPRPTPASINIHLPGLHDDASISVNSGQDDTNPMACDSPVQPLGCDLGKDVVDEKYPDPDLLPLPALDLSSTIVEMLRIPVNNSGDEPQPSSQMPTPPASPPMLFSAQRKLGKPLPSAYPPPIACEETDDNLIQDVSIPSPILLAIDSTAKILAGQIEAFDETPKHTMELEEIEAHKETPIFETGDETSLPGSLPEDPSLTTSTASKTTQTVAARLAGKSTPRPTAFHPSVRAIIRQPLEIALAMQLRPGLGAGADPAWMVRFLMAMFGWFAVLVSGQENY